MKKTLLADMIELQYKLVYNHFLISLIQYKQWVWIHGTQKTYFWSLWPKAEKQSFLFIYIPTDDVL